MSRTKDNPILKLVSSTISPFIMVFALYVVFHGHYSPGGGFQGGTLLAAAVILIRLAAGIEKSQMLFNSNWATPLGSVGVLLYFGTGLVAMLMGGNFLNYHYLPLGTDEVMLRSNGILMVEVGVAIAVMAILISIFDDLSKAGPDV